MVSSMQDFGIYSVYVMNCASLSKFVVQRFCESSLRLCVTLSTSCYFGRLCCHCHVFHLGIVIKDLCCCIFLSSKVVIYIYIYIICAAQWEQYCVQYNTFSSISTTLTFIL